MAIERYLLIKDQMMVLLKANQKGLFSNVISLSSNY